MSNGDRVEICGATFFNDVVEGQQYDNCKVHVFVDLDDTQGRAFGRGTYAYKGLKSAAFPGLMKAYEECARRGVPFLADVEFKRVTNGKTESTHIVAVHPVPLGAPGAPGSSGAAAGGAVQGGK